MSHTRSISRVHAAAAALSLIALLPATELAGQDAMPGVVQGVVLDRESRAPVSSAAVRLESSADTTRAFSGSTDGDGRFEFLNVPAGDYQLRIGRIGYRELVRPLAVASGQTTEVTAEIVSAAVTLDPVLVTAMRPLSSTGSTYRPGGTSPFGQRMDRAEIEARRMSRLSDLLRTFAGVRVDRAATSQDTRVTFRGRCSPAVFLDGLETTSIENLNATLQPEDLQSIEVFRGAETPVTYRRNDCGAILLWSRGRNLPESSRSFWFRLLLGAAAFTAAFFAFR